MGSSGREVRDIQGRLAAAGFLDESCQEVSSGAFGDETDRAVRAFQQGRGLIADGIVGPDTWRSLVEASRRLGNRFIYLREPPLRGDDVAELKRRLNALGFYSGKENGIFDKDTALAVEQFQRNSGLSSDGIVGSETVEALLRLARVTKPTSVAAVRESEKGLPSSGLEGRRVLLDAGHGFPPDPGEVGPHGTRESEAAEFIVELLGERLVDLQAVVLYSRRRGEYIPDRRRVTHANRLAVDLMVSVHMNSSTDPRAHGASCYYYGSGNYVSPYGYRLANHVQDGLVEDLGMNDCRAHPMALPMLRDTRMPVVIVEPLFITNPDEEGLLLDKGFAGRVAVSVSEAIERYFCGIKAHAEG
jgi:N-acetylmuramoyl-L-alanine amidase